MTLTLQQQQLVETFAHLRDSQDRLSWLLDQARKRPLLPLALRTEANRVEGCMARLWLVAEFRDGRCYYQSESDSLIVKAVAGLMCEYYSGHTPAEILNHPPDFLVKLGITQHLAPNRRNGLARVWDRIRLFAESHASPTSAAPRE